MEEWNADGQARSVAMLQRDAWITDYQVDVVNHLSCTLTLTVFIIPNCATGTL